MHEPVDVEFSDSSDFWHRLGLIVSARHSLTTGGETRTYRCALLVPSSFDSGSAVVEAVTSFSYSGGV